MNHDPIKVVFHFPVPICDGEKAINPYTGEKQTAQQWVAWKKARDVKQWLADNGHAPPTKIYNNCDPPTKTGEIVVVLSDKNVALMLKLALA